MALFNSWLCDNIVYMCVPPPWHTHKIYSCLPSSIKAHSNDAKRFKTSLKSYLIEHAFYSLEEYYQLQWLWFLVILFYLFNFIYFVYLYSQLQLNLNNYKISCNVEHDLLFFMCFWLFYVWSWYDMLSLSLEAIVTLRYINLNTYIHTYTHSLNPWDCHKTMGCGTRHSQIVK
jgi:hypothetical protein